MVGTLMASIIPDKRRTARMIAVNIDAMVHPLTSFDPYLDRFLSRLAELRLPDMNIDVNR